MTHLPYELYRTDQVRLLDQTAIESFSIPGYTLMRYAGQAVFDVIREHWADVGHITIVCGTGNNGGDGYVVALLAKQAGLEVTLLQMGSTAQIQGDADLARQDWLAAGGNETYWQDAEQFVAELDRSGLLVDALLGTGLQRDVSGDWRQLIDLANRHALPVLSVDIPSGLNADTGAVMGSCIQAELTVSFIGLKQGMFTGAGRAYCGRIRFDRLQVPDGVYKAVQPAATRLDRDNACQMMLPPRTAMDHKGCFGHVLVVGGAPGMPGAALLAATAAARTGAGLVSVATHPDHATHMISHQPELMCHGVSQATGLGRLLERASVVLLGPGLGRSDWARTLFARVLDSQLPIVVDADALKLLASEKLTRDQLLLTPHPGEAARLLNVDKASIQRDRFAAARHIATDYNAVVVLKGSGSLVQDQDNQVTVCTSGNPGMASGGMGDVLGGIIAALIAQGLGLAQAGRLGVWLHGRAADFAAAYEGERGMLASDLLPYIRLLMNDCKWEPDEREGSWS